MNQKMKRRDFLKTCGLFGAALVSPILMRPLKSFGEACEKATPANPMVNMLGYVPVSKTKKQSCSNCIQFQGNRKASSGKCPIFQGCEVSTKGWCKSWSKMT